MTGVQTCALPIYTTIGSIIFALLAYGFYKNKRIQRAPSVLINLIFLGVSTYMFSEGLWLLGLITFVISGTTIIAAVSVIPEDK